MFLIYFQANPHRYTAIDRWVSKFSTANICFHIYITIANAFCHYWSRAWLKFKSSWKHRFYQITEVKQGVVSSEMVDHFEMTGTVSSLWQAANHNKEGLACRASEKCTLYFQFFILRNTKNGRHKALSFGGWWWKRSCITIFSMGT